MTHFNAAFQDWFGDSQVVDEDGEPLVVYHGTHDATFSKFHGGATDMMYFTPDPDYASSYMHPSMSAVVRTRPRSAIAPGIYPVYLRILNLFDPASNPEHERIFREEFFGRWGNRTPLDPKLGLPDWTDAEDLIEFFDETDYDFDGLILAESHGAVTYAVKDPTQIKSAYNRGTWDSRDPDIRKNPFGDAKGDETLPAGTLLYHGSPEPYASEIRRTGRILGRAPVKMSRGNLDEGGLIWFSTEEVIAEQWAQGVEADEKDYIAPGDVFAWRLLEPLRVVSRYRELDANEAEVLSELLGIPDYKLLREGDDLGIALRRAWDSPGAGDRWESYPTQRGTMRVIWPSILEALGADAFRYSVTTIAIPANYLVPERL